MTEQQIGTATLDIYARLRDTEQEFLIGELEIPITLNTGAVLTEVTEAIEEHRPPDDSDG